MVFSNTRDLRSTILSYFKVLSSVKVAVGDKENNGKIRRGIFHVVSNGQTSNAKGGLLRMPERTLSDQLMFGVVKRN